MRALNRLSTKWIESSKREPGLFADGGGLWLRITPSRTRSWIFRYTRAGKTHDIGLGSYLNVSLELARKKAGEQRAMLGNGEDPKSQRLAARASEAGRMTFKECAAQYIEANKPGWKNAKHGDQWTSTLETYAYPVIGGLDVAHVETAHILKILEPIWASKSETASRLRGRIERVLAWATTRRFRAGDNPARWTHHLDTILPRPSKVKKTSHHAALPHGEVHAFLQKLKSQAGVAPRALEFTMLTAARTGEVIGATWAEIDAEQAVWIIPAERMKARREHRIPLSSRALEILKEMKEVRENDFVFPGFKSKTGLSNMAMLKLLQRMGRADITVHGFRSTFRDWAGETTAHPREVIEHAMAHQLKDKAEAAYARGTLFKKRIALMADWAAYLETPPAKMKEAA